MPWPIRFGPLPRITTFGRGRRLGLALLLERAVHVRRERLELGRAGVDALVGRRRCRPRAGARARCPRRARSACARSASPKPGALQLAQQVVGQIARRRRPPPSRRARRSAGTASGTSGSMCVSRWISSMLQPRSSARNTAHMRRSVGMPAPAAASCRPRPGRRRPHGWHSRSRSCRARAIGTP